MTEPGSGIRCWPSGWHIRCKPSPFGEGVFEAEDEVKLGKVSAKQTDEVSKTGEGKVR